MMKIKIKKDSEVLRHIINYLFNSIVNNLNSYTDI